MQNPEDSKEEEEPQRGGVHHQQIAHNDEEGKEEEEATAITMPPQSSLDDLFSDTMELACYLHRRVQEIGKQFRHRSFRIHGNKQKELPSGFIHGLPCGSNRPLRASIDDSQRVCDPADHGNLQKKMENCVSGEEKAASLAEEKIGLVKITSGVSFGPYFTNTFSPDFSGCTYMNGRTINLYDIGSDAGSDGDVALLLREKRVSSVQDSQLLPTTQRGENVTSSQNLPLESASPLCLSQCPLPGPVCCANTPKNVSGIGLLRDTLLTQEYQDQYICLDAADAPTSMPRKEKNPASSAPQSPLPDLTPCGNSSKNLLPLLQRSISGVNSSQNVSNADLSLRMPSLQEHACSDAEDAARVLSPMQKGKNLFEQLPQAGLSVSCVDSSEENICDASFLRKGVEIPVLQEHVEQRICSDAQGTDLPSSLAVADNASPLSQLPRSMSSVDSSECDNCRLGNVMGHLTADKARSKNSTKAYRFKSEEIDAMSEAGCLDLCKKQGNDDEGTIVAAEVDTACAGSEEIKNSALHLLLNAIQVTSGEDSAEKNDDYFCRPSSSHMKKHVLGVGGDGTLGERKEVFEPSSLLVIQNMRKAGTNGGQCGLSVRIHGDKHPSPSSSHDVRDNTRKRKTAELPSNVVPLPVERFPIVRKRSARCPKTALKEEPSGNSVPIVIRFKSLSEVDFNSRKGMKKPSDKKHEERRKRPSLEMQEGGHILHVSRADSGRRENKRCLELKQAKRERTSDKKQGCWKREDNSSTQEKRTMPSDDLEESKGREQTPPMHASEMVEVKDGELLVFSRRGRSQILPNKFSDSVLQPWKKTNRRKD